MDPKDPFRSVGDQDTIIAEKGSPDNGRGGRNSGKSGREERRSGREEKTGGRKKREEKGNLQGREDREGKMGRNGPVDLARGIMGNGLGKFLNKGMIPLALSREAGEAPALPGIAGNKKGRSEDVLIAPLLLAMSIPPFPLPVKSVFHGFFPGPPSGLFLPGFPRPRRAGLLFTPL